MAEHDSLTGLPNRRHFQHQLELQLKFAKRRGSPLCLAVVDLDFFKVHNDNLGHLAGDDLLVAVADRWRGCIRDVDQLARVGGDEFMLVLPDCGVEGALHILRRMHDSMPAEQTCSSGVAQWDRSESADELLARADVALYKTKRGGRGAVTVAAGSERTLAAAAMEA
jgi:diguanylate cyclase (GGDEF)-like protein